MSNDGLSETLNVPPDETSWLRSSLANLRPVSLAMLMGATAAAFIEGAVDGAFEGDAHTFLMAVYKDPGQSMNVRVDAAKAAVGYEKPKLNSSEHSLKSGEETISEWLKALDGRTRGIPSNLR